MDLNADGLFARIEELRRKKDDSEFMLNAALPRYEYTQEQIETTKEEIARTREILATYEVALTEQKTYVDKFQDEISEYDEEISRLERARVRALAEEAARRALIDREEEFDQVTVNAPWREKIKEYQLVGSRQMAAVKKGLEADERGLGKSLISLAYSDMLQSKRLLIMAPLKTARNFRREVRRWTPARRPVYTVGADKATRAFMLQSLLDAREVLPGYTVIVNFEAWRRDPELKELLKKLRFDTVIVDETHNIKNFKTAAFKGVKEIIFANNECPSCGAGTYPKKVPHLEVYQCKECHNTFNEFDSNTGQIDDWQSIKNVLLMTGSPIMNKPAEIWPQIHLLDPIGFPSEKKFIADFLIWDSEKGAYRWRFRGAERLVEMLGMRYISRKRKDVGSDRPDPTEEILEIEFNEETAPEQYGVYKQMQNEFEVLLESGETLQAPVVIAQLTRLQQLILWPPGVKIYGMEFDHEKQKFKSTGKVIDHVNVYESAILDQVYEAIKERLDEDKRIIVFSKYKDANRELSKRLDQIGVPNDVYDGDVSNDKRELIEEEWDARTTLDVSKVLFTTYAAGGESLNFTVADTVFTLDLAWNPEIDSQAVGRADREGNVNQVEIVRVTTTGNTVYQWLEGLNEFKKELINGFEQEVNLAEIIRQQIRNGRVAA